MSEQILYCGFCDEEYVLPDDEEIVSCPVCGVMFYDEDASPEGEDLEG